MTEIYAGDRLHRLRKKRGMSLEEVASGVGVTSSHISQIENGKRQPSFTLLSALAEFFDVDPTFFIETRGKYYGHGRKIRTLREKSGMSIEELANGSKLDASYLEEVEEGKVELAKEELRRVAQTFSLELVDFNDCLEVHLEEIRDICALVFNMSAEDTDAAIEFIKTKIRVER